MPDDGVVRTIHGVSVSFPCRPYPSQMSMMEKIIKGIERKENCLLESPTGSGKSLALLCAALAWQKAEFGKARKENLEEPKKACTCTLSLKVPNNELNLVQQEMTNGCHGDVEDCADFKPTTSFRTPSGMSPSIHSIPSQALHPPVVGEIQRTVTAASGDANDSHISGIQPTGTTGDGGSDCNCYTASKANRKVPKIYFGTRTHKQITQIVRELNKTHYANSRMSILASRDHTCIHPGVSKYNSKTEGCKELLDGPGCLFQSNVRKFAFQANVREYLPTAWDIEDMVTVCSNRKIKACPYFSTRALRSEADIVFCPYNYLVSPTIRKSLEISLKDQIVIFDEAHNIENSACEEMCRSVNQEDLQRSVKELSELISNKVKPEEHSALKNVCENLDHFITTNVACLEQRSFNESSHVWHGYDIVAILNELCLGPKHLPHILHCYNEVSSEEDGAKREGEAKSGQPKLSQSSLKLLDDVLCVLDYMYRQDLRFLNDFKVALLKSAVFGHAPDTSGSWLSKRKGRKELREVFSVKFWCFSPAVAFSDFECTRSVVLTSGTLSPMQSFQSELGMEFKITLEANHVINDSQVWVGAVGRGPHNELLQATYKNTEQLNFQDELGHVIVSVCQTVPRGVLCFLPSYKMLETLTNRWQTTGLWEELLKYKQVICEPRASDRVDFDELIHTFYEVVNNDADTKDPCDSGALFMAVCRGKVSEGLDFADNNARAVITVELKRQYNDQNIKRGLLSGSDWYEIQAFRALNQALGRCIRHRNDWGALIMVDDRFVQRPQKYIRGLSKWVRNKACTFGDFTQALASLSNFTACQMKPKHASSHSIEGSVVTVSQSDVCSLHPATSSSVIVIDESSTSGEPSLVNPHSDHIKSVVTIDASPDKSEQHSVIDSANVDGSAMVTGINKENHPRLLGNKNETAVYLDFDGKEEKNCTASHFPLISSSNSKVANIIDTNDVIDKQKIIPKFYSTPNQKLLTVKQDNRQIKNTIVSGFSVGDDLMSVPFSPIATSLSSREQPVKNGSSDVNHSYSVHHSTKIGDRDATHSIQIPVENTYDDTASKMDTEIDSFHKENDDWLTSSPTLFESENIQVSDDNHVRTHEMSRIKPKLLFRNTPMKTFGDSENSENKETSQICKKQSNKRKTNTNSKSDDSEDSDFLNTKRKAGKIQSRTRTNKRSKGVKYIDEDGGDIAVVEENSHKKMVVVCQKCGSTLITTTAGVEKKRCTPSFLKNIWSGRLDLYVFGNDAIVSTHLQPITSNLGVPLNCYWFPEHGCCLQYLHCVNCHKVNHQERTTDGQKVTIPAVKVVISSDTSSVNSGQIWMLGSAVLISRT